MTDKEKDLLLRDISARISYGVKCSVEDREGVYPIVGSYRREGYGAAYAYIDVPPFGDIIIDIVKPYLRPMEDMTKDEKEHYNFITSGYYTYDFAATLITDFCHKKHLDNRGLIGQRLALKAPEGMYDPKSMVGVH